MILKQIESRWKNQLIPDITCGDTKSNYFFNIDEAIECLNILKQNGHKEFIIWSIYEKIPSSPLCNTLEFYAKDNYENHKSTEPE